LDNQNGTLAAFYEPRGLAIDGQGNLYVADWGNNAVRMVTPSGATSTLAGNGDAGFADGTGGPTGTALFNGPDGVAVDSSGNVFVTDSLNNRIREIAAGTHSVSTLAGSGVAGFLDGDGGTAQFSSPVGLAIDAQGTLYVGDSANQRIRIITR
jgi:sugar lactone lactonase YvrE